MSSKVASMAMTGLEAAAVNSAAIDSDLRGLDGEVAGYLKSLQDD